MGKEAKLWACVGIVLSIVVIIVALDIISLRPSALKSAVALMFGLVAIIFGKTALSRASEGERILCYAPIALGAIALVVWLITELL